VIRDHSHEHLSAESIQAFLEGELPAGQHSLTEEHLAGCARCAGEVEMWRLVFSELGELAQLRPQADFASRVMADVHVPQGLPLAARIRALLTGWAPGAALAGHVPSERLQELAEGMLPARQVTRLQGHLDGCSRCSEELVAWRGLMGSLASMSDLAPADGFATRVMSEVRIPAPAPTRAPVREVVAGTSRALAWAARMIPTSRQAWATLSGIAVAPMATLGLLVYTVFSHPMLTPGSLLSFLGWKAAAVGAAAWEASSALLVESASLFRAYTILESLAATPAMLAGGFLLFSSLMVAATWVLYRNLIANPPVDSQYARASV
jgi:anti-sigma factor RsiW